MANSLQHPGVGAQIVRAGAIALGVLLGGTMLLDISAPDGALAQGKKDAKEAKKDAPKKDAKSSPPESAWVKICDKGQLKGKDKEGKEVTKDLETCMTLTEQIHPDTGMTMIGATLVQMKMDGKEKSFLQVTVPPGTVLPHGAGMLVFSKDLWDKAAKKEKLEKAEEEKLAKSAVKLTYTHCLPMGCQAETEATPELINALKGGGGFLVLTVRAPNQPVQQPVPLSGFTRALTGPPTDTQEFKNARVALMKHIAERQKHLVAELKKQQENLNKMQPNVVAPKDGKDAKAEKKK
jgi:invasion protein IalB